MKNTIIILSLIELYLSSIAGKGELVKLADTAGFIRDC
jgi:hypothetical protein